METLKVWLASLPEIVQIGTSRQRPSKIFRPAALEKQLAEPSPVVVEHDRIYGWVELTVWKER